MPSTLQQAANAERRLRKAARSPHVSRRTRATSCETLRSCHASGLAQARSILREARTVVGLRGTRGRDEGAQRRTINRTAVRNAGAAHIRRARVSAWLTSFTFHTHAACTRIPRATNRRTARTGAPQTSQALRGAPMQSVQHGSQKEPAVARRVAPRVVCFAALQAGASRARARTIFVQSEDVEGPGCSAGRLCRTQSAH